MRTTYGGSAMPLEVPGLTASQSSSSGQASASSVARTVTATETSGAAQDITRSDVNTGTNCVPSCSITGNEISSGASSRSSA